ncbi:MAG: GIY-YIG nuclease family protein [Gemmatimonadaceae bacterium]
MNRKELIRQYKERRPPMGVYQVRSSVTGRAIVAASRDVTSALNMHRAQLRLNGHPTRELQADWAAHGQDSFVFEVLDLLPPTDDPGYDPLGDLVALEDLWLEKLGLSADKRHTIDASRLRKPKPSA